MKKICYVTTISMTLKAFVLDTAKYLHENGNYDISFICNYDKDFADSLPEYIHYYPVSMERGISIGGIKAMLEIKKFLNEKNLTLFNIQHRMLLAIQHLQVLWNMYLLDYIVSGELHMLDFLVLKE